MDTKTRFFKHMCIAIVYIISISQLIYTNEYLEIYATEKLEKEQLYYQMLNKHSLAVGKKNIAGEKAWEYFEKAYLPKLFKACDEAYYAINYYQRQTQIPCTGEWWWCLAQGPKYKQIPYYKIKAYDRIAYYAKIVKQDKRHVTVSMQIQGRPMGWSELSGLFTVHVVMDYAYNVVDVYSNDQNKITYPLFGKGHLPTTYSCQSLRSNIGSTVTL